MRPSQPKHCKHCASFHSAGRRNPYGGLEKYNAWCCAAGKPAAKAIGWCIQNGKKVTQQQALIITENIPRLRSKYANNTTRKSTANT